MKAQACKSCGIMFDLDFVPKNPHHVCPNPSCRAPLSADAVEARFIDAPNPDVAASLRNQLHNDVADHDGTDTMTTGEKIAAGIIAPVAAPTIARKAMPKITSRAASSPPW